MKKIFLTLILVSISIFTLHSGDHQDIAFSFSPSSTYGYYGPFGVEDSLRLDLSMSLGISSRFEAGLGIITELTPDIVDENTIYFEVLYSIIGSRSTASKVAGTGINTLIGIGGFYSHVFSNGRNGAGAYITLTPITLGSPISGRRERALRTNVGYDFINNRVVLFFSIVGFDFYVRGTYRDYY